MDSTVYNNRTNTRSIFLENDDIYVEENKKETSSLIISAGNT